MAALSRVQTLLRSVACRATISSTRGQCDLYSPCIQVLTSRCSSTAPNTPILTVQPEVSLCDEVVNIEAHGLSPGQEVTLKAHVYTENGKYRFESKAHYKADADGKISVPKDPSLGGSYKGIEPMGPITSLEPIPEVSHKHPRLVKWDVTKPFDYTLELVDEGEGQEKVIASTKMERNFMADYVERIPVKTGGAEGVMFLPKQRGSSDPLPFIIDMRGLLTNLVVDRAVTLASHGFAVFAFDYFLPRRHKSQEENVYMDSQAFLDIIDFVKAHPRLDENRIGMTSSCYGGSMMLNAATRLKLPVKCMVAAGFVDILCVRVGWKNLDGSLLEPAGPVEEYMETWTDENGQSWITFKEDLIDDRMTGKLQARQDTHFCLEENLDCPLLMFAHKDDQHIPSFVATNYLRDRLERAGKSHLVEYEVLPGTGHFLEVPFQPINLISSLYDPTTLSAPKLYYTNYGGQDTKQALKDQKFAWRRIVNFFRKHLEVKEMYRNDWTSS